MVGRSCGGHEICLGESIARDSITILKRSDEYLLKLCVLSYMGRYIYFIYGRHTSSNWLSLSDFACTIIKEVYITKFKQTTIPIFGEILFLLMKVVFIINIDFFAYSFKHIIWKTRQNTEMFHLILTSKKPYMNPLYRCGSLKT